MQENHESHRAATMLELLYDLVTVISVAIAAEGLHHSLLHNHAHHGFITFTTVFFAIWWAWMNFTWFASSYDSDDVIYRLSVFMQMVGYMVFAAGINKVYSDMDFRISWFGFLIIRISLVSMWFRVAINNIPHRKLAIQNIIGTLLCQFGWFILAFKTNKDIFLTVFFVMVILELFVPFYTKRNIKQSWHTLHMIERYGLLTIIVLGECVLSSVKVLKTFIENQNYSDILTIFSSFFVITFSIWWLYFNEKEHVALKERKNVFLWGYGHFFVFISIAILGAIFSSFSENSEATKFINISLALFLIGLWLVHDVTKKYPLIKKLELPISSLILITSLYFYENIVLTSSLMLSLTVYRSLNTVKCKINKLS